MPDISSTSTADRRLSIQDTRTYQVPGGPLAKNLGETEVKVLAEIRRGGPYDGEAGR